MGYYHASKRFVEQAKIELNQSNQHGNKEFDTNVIIDPGSLSAPTPAPPQTPTFSTPTTKTKVQGSNPDKGCQRLTNEALQIKTSTRRHREPLSQAIKRHPSNTRLWPKPGKTPFSQKNGTRYRAYSTPQKLNHMQYAEAKSDHVAGASNGYTKDAVH